MSLGKNIKNARIAKGMSQKELADAISTEEEKIGNTSISNWENDINKPDADTIALLCKILDVDANFLLDFELENKINNLNEITREQLDNLTLENVLIDRKGKIEQAKNLPIEKQEAIANAIKSVLDMIDEEDKE